MGPNLIPGGSTYSGGGTYTLNVLANTTYIITWGPNDNTVNICGDVYSNPGNGQQTTIYTGVCTTLVFSGPGGSTVTAVVQKPKPGSKTPVPRNFTWTISADGATATAAWATPPGFVNSTELWTSNDNVTFTLASTTAAPGTSSAVAGPTSPAFKYAKIRWISTTSSPSNGPFTAVLSVPTSNGLLTSLVSYWKLDETGNNVRDDSQHSGNAGFQLASNGSMTDVAGIISRAASSNAAAGTLSRLSTNWAVVAGDSFTVSIWVNIQAVPAGFRGIFTYWNGASIAYFLWFNNNSDITYTTQPASGGAQTNNQVVAGPPTFGTWYHIVFGYDNATQRTFWQLNAGTRNFSNSVGIFDASAGGTLGMFTYAGGGTGPSNAYADECGWWRRVLTTAEVTALYNSGAGFGYTNFR
jgi:hypothetical protein